MSNCPITLQCSYASDWSSACVAQECKIPGGLLEMNLEDSVAVSIAASIGSLALQLGMNYLAKPPGVSFKQHLRQQIKMGAGLPLDAIRNDPTFDKWKCQIKLNKTQVIFLAKAVEASYGLKHLDLNDSLPKAGIESAQKIASALAINTSVTYLE